MLGQAAYLFPWIWLALVSVLVRPGRRAFSGSETEPAERFLLCQAVVPLAAFTAVACTRPVLPHWTLVGFLSLFPLLGRTWEDAPERLTRRLVGFVGAPAASPATVVLVQTRTGVLQQGGEGTLGLLKVSRDPTLDLYGWDQVAASWGVAGCSTGPTRSCSPSNWYYSGQLAFATREHSTPVALLQHGRRPELRLLEPAERLGRPGRDPRLPQRAFDRAALLRSLLLTDRADRRIRGRTAPATPIRKVRLFRCVRQTTPFPFDKPRPPSPARTMAQGPTEGSASSLSR